MVLLKNDPHHLLRQTQRNVSKFHPNLALKYMFCFILFMTTEVSMAPEPEEAHHNTLPNLFEFLTA